VGRDEPLEFDVVGVRVRGGDDPVTSGDRWHIGSCCKSMTAVLYARLVERGDAAWGAPLSDLFPDLGDAIDPGWTGVTIDDVFVAQGGLPANLSRSAMKEAYRDTRPVADQRTQAAAAAASAPRLTSGATRAACWRWVRSACSISAAGRLPTRNVPSPTTPHC